MWFTPLPDTPINITDFTTLVSSSIPVTSRDEVLLFGTVILGLPLDDVKKCLSGSQSDTEVPNIVFHYLQLWVTKHPQQTAYDLLKAMEEAKVGVSYIKTLRTFFEEQEFIQGTF